MKELPRTIASDQVHPMLRALTCRDLNALLQERLRDLRLEVGEAVTDTQEDQLPSIIKEAREEARSIEYCLEYFRILGLALSAVTREGGTDG